ncbi:MAG: HIT family protein [Deltaproteobacteria bacterium]
MNQLWAPWRLELIQGEGAAANPPGCIFCLFPAEAEAKGALTPEGRACDQARLILGRSRHAFVILNKFPYNNGHLMVIPRRHTADFAGLPPEEADDLHRLLQRSLGLLAEAYAPDGYNVGMNLGRIAGAGIAEHLHYHVVPRWNGDTNFMPVLAETKVMIEHLAASWERLRAAFERAPGR